MYFKFCGHLNGRKSSQANVEHEDEEQAGHEPREDIRGDVEVLALVIDGVFRAFWTVGAGRGVTGGCRGRCGGGRRGRGSFENAAVVALR